MEQESAKNHSISIKARTLMNLTGVEKVISMEPQLVELETVMDHLAIKGQDLHAEKLDMEKGELHLTGKIQGLLYSDKKGKKNASAIAKRLFR
ncbi:MAG: sporulation protein YabP [Wujia sp.]